MVFGFGDFDQWLLGWGGARGGGKGKLEKGENGRNLLLFNPPHLKRPVHGPKPGSNEMKDGYGPVLRDEGQKLTPLKS